MYLLITNIKPRIDQGEAKLVGPNGTWIGFRNVIAEKRTPYPLRAMFTYKQNPMQSVPNIAKTRKMFENLDLIVTIDTMPSDTVMMSDVVLPECTYLEREDPVKSFAGVQPAIILRNKVIDPMYETQALFDILKGLSKKIEKPLFEISAKYDEELKEYLEDDGFDETFSDNYFELSKALRTFPRAHKQRDGCRLLW